MLMNEFTTRAGIRYTIPTQQPYNVLDQNIVDTTQDVVHPAVVEENPNPIHKLNIENFGLNGDTYYIGNITNQIFVVFLSVAIALGISKINNNIVRFIFLCLLGLCLSREYGISLAIIFYFIVTINTPSVFIIIIAILALIHILFLPNYLIVTDNVNGNYIIEAVLGILTLIFIYYKDFRSLCAHVQRSIHSILNDSRLEFDNLTSRP